MAGPPKDRHVPQSRGMRTDIGVSPGGPLDNCASEYLRAVAAMKLSPIGRHH